MRRPAAILGVLLFASLLANAIFLARLAGPTQVPTETATRPLEKLHEELSTVRRELATERAIGDDLRVRIRELESEKALLIQSTPLPPPVPQKLEGFPDRLRKYLRNMTGTPGTADPLSKLEMSEAFLELYRISATRFKDLGAYADAMKVFYEVSLEEANAPLSGRQSVELARALADLGQALSRVPSEAAPERLLKELEAEAALAARLNALLSPQQRDKLALLGGLGVPMGGAMASEHVTPAEAEATIVEGWMQAYQLDEVRRPAAQAACRAFLEGLRQLDAGARDRREAPGEGTPESYDGRIRAVRAQISALQALEASLTPEQRERLRTRPMKEFRLITE